MNIPISVQLYTLKDEVKNNFKGTLEKVAEIGYKGVEFAGDYGERTAKDLKILLDKLGLKVSGCHTGLDELQNNLQKAIEFNLEIESQYIICPYSKFTTRKDISDAAKLFNKIGARCRENNIQFCYHNHAHEFEKFDGEYGLDILFNETDVENMKAEFDTYWIKYAGLDPVEYMNKFSDRCILTHIKDMDASSSRSFTEIGNGIIDIKSIADESKKNGVSWLIVEQDICKGSALDSVKLSYKNLKTLGLA